MMDSEDEIFSLFMLNAEQGEVFDFLCERFPEPYKDFILLTHDIKGEHKYGGLCSPRNPFRRDMLEVALRWTERDKKRDKLYLKERGL